MQMSIRGITGIKFIRRAAIAVAIIIPFTVIGGVARAGNLQLSLPPRDVASAISFQVYVGGLELWDRLWLTIGQPNAYNRCDRAMIRVDLRPWLMAGQIRRAILVWQYEPRGFVDRRKLEISLFRREEEVFDIYSGFVIPADPFLSWTVDGSKGAQRYQLDLTQEANRALRQGWGSIAIRIRDCYSDEHGNPGSKVQMVGIVAKSIVLKVEE